MFTFLQQVSAWIVPGAAAWRGVLFGLVALGATGAGRAQSVSMIRTTEYMQTGPTAFILGDRFGMPRGFDLAAFIPGTDTVPARPITLTLPNGTTEPLIIGPRGWSYGGGSDTEAKYLAAFPYANYTLNFGGSSYLIPLTDPFYAPVGTHAPAGNWANSVLKIDPALPLTLTFPFPPNFNSANSWVSAYVVPDVRIATIIAQRTSAPDTTETNIQLSFPAGTFPADQYYIARMQAVRHVPGVPSTAPGFTSIYGQTVTYSTFYFVASEPEFTQQPAGHTVVSGGTLVLRAQATADATYHWERAGVRLTQASADPTLVLSGAALVAGDYICVATNSLGATRSTPATVRLVGAAEASRLTNLSILTQADAGDNVLTMGAVITGGTGALPVVVRAVGPTLGTAFNLGGVLPDPTLTVQRSGATAPMATNDNWGGSAELAAAFRAVGAFPLAAASLDSAFVPAGGLAPGEYSVRIAAKTGQSGQVIAELYDASAATRTGATPRLTNVSTLKRIDAGSTLSVGFVLAGATSRTLLIRGVGPTLGSAFNLSGAMPDPKLELFNNNTRASLATSDDWDGNTQLAALMKGVGAFDLASASAKDAVLIATLLPGAYSVQVSGTGAGGTALVEVYEVQ